MFHLNKILGGMDMRRVLGLLVFLIITFIGVSTANAELRWSKLDFDSNTRIYVSPGYEQDHSAFSLVGKDLYLSVDEGKSWGKTSTMPVWYVRLEQGQNIYIMQGADRNDLAIYKFNPLVQGDWERICSAPPATVLFTVMNNGTVIAIKPAETTSSYQTLRAEKPNYSWQDAGLTTAGEFLESTPDGIVYTRENGTDLVSKSLTYGQTWEDASSVFTTNKFYFPPTYNSKKEVFSITNNRNISISYDQGENWQERMTGMERGSRLVDLAFSPDYKLDQKIYALDKDGHVFVTDNILSDWKSFGISADYIDESGFNSLVVLPGGKLLAGASDGVYEAATYIPPGILGRSEFVIGKTSYTIEQQDWLMDTAPYVDSGRTFVPVRYLAYALGIDDNNILWDSSKNEATLIKNKDIVKITVGSRSLLVNMKTVAMDVPPQIRDGRVFLPARWVAEAFGGNVSWDEQKKAVTIEYRK